MNPVLSSVPGREDSSRIFVAVGYGFFVEMNHDEALRFIDKKTSQLTASVHHLSLKSQDINQDKCHSMISSSEVVYLQSFCIVLEAFPQNST